MYHITYELFPYSLGVRVSYKSRGNVVLIHACPYGFSERTDCTDYLESTEMIREPLRLLLTWCMSRASMTLNHE
jgi:hypothetical protein